MQKGSISNLLKSINIRFHSFSKNDLLYPFHFKLLIMHKTSFISYKERRRVLLSQTTYIKLKPSWWICQPPNFYFHSIYSPLSKKRNPSLRFTQHNHQMDLAKSHWKMILSTKSVACAHMHYFLKKVLILQGHRDTLIEV